MSAVKLIRELLHHTQQTCTKKDRKKEKLRTKELVSKKRTKREEELMSGPPHRLQEEK